MIDWSALLQHYGYFAILVGTFFEGESILLLAAYAVHQHLLNFWWVIAAAMLGGLFGDQLYYQIGARYGDQFIQKRPELSKKFQKASHLIQRYPALIILLMRFAWGFRTVIPISFGIRHYSLWRYILTNIIACFIWAMLVVSIGLQVSRALHQFWNFLMPHQNGIWIVAAVIGCILMSKLLYHLIQLKNKK